MTIPAYVTRPPAMKWILANEPEFKYLIDFVIFENLELFLAHIKKTSVSKKDSEIQNCLIVAVDISDMHLEVIDHIKTINSQIKVVLFELIQNSDSIIKYLNFGYNSIIEIGSKSHEVISIIQKLTKREISIGSDLIDKLIMDKVYLKFSSDDGIGKKNNDNMQIITSMLTEKQQIVFECLLKGYTYKEISQRLGISFYAVNQRAKTVYKKAGVNSRIELMNLMLH